MQGVRHEEKIEMNEELIKKACSLSMEAHKSRGKEQYIYWKSPGSSSEEVVFAFAGSWLVKDWFKPQEPFGETKINLAMFPSLRSIGNNENAMVNEAFMHRFEEILKSSLKKKVEKAMRNKKHIVFAGHSSGGPMAILMTLWVLEQYIRPKVSQIPPRCVTFGSPLSGDRIFPHALRRENWAHYFIHFVMKYDIVPRIMLAPSSSIKQALEPILSFIKQNSQDFQHKTIQPPNETEAFFMTVMKNASSVVSHAACKLMGSTNLLSETVFSFVKLSPYRPFGTYIFCTGNGKLVVMENPDAVLQMLFYCAQLSSKEESAEVACTSLNEHTSYQNEIKKGLYMQNVVYLNDLKDLPLSSNGSVTGEINTALNDLGLSTRARLCLRAAGVLEKQKLDNQEKIDSYLKNSDSNKYNIEKALSIIHDYQKVCEVRKVSYYDAFKLQKGQKDFEANVKRIELAGIWDEITEMLKRYELPDEFESRKEWIDLGTKFRRLVEPLDIANYYRHSKNDDTGTYLKDGSRPKRYRYTQRWHEHAEMMKAEECSSETCFWAQVEDLSRNKSSMEKILSLEGDVFKWVQKEELGMDVFLAGSTFAKWWKELPDQHRSDSLLGGYMSS